MPCLLKTFFVRYMPEGVAFPEEIEVEAESEEDAEDMAKEILHEGDSNWERAECDTGTS